MGGPEDQKDATGVDPLIRGPVGQKRNTVGSQVSAPRSLVRVIRYRCGYGG
jgi:hypothetical protein